jgi:hypothetical protein
MTPNKADRTEITIVTRTGAVTRVENFTWDDHPALAALICEKSFMWHDYDERFSVRLERKQRGDIHGYWTMYRRVHGILKKTYVSHVYKLTPTALHLAASKLLDE